MSDQLNYSRRNCTAPLFMGQGAISAAQAYDLISRLIHSFEVLSGMQQGGGTKKQNNESENELEELALDLVAALTGHIWRKLDDKDDRSLERP